MLILAGVLSIALGVIHSILGERMIFHPLRQSHEPSAMSRYQGILWATWHMVTIFGACIGFFLMNRAGLTMPGDLTSYITIAMFLGAVLVVVGTHGRHPGWIVLLLIAILIWIAG